MTNTSASGGYLLPISFPPLEDNALDAVLQGLVVGVTGLSGDLVRPRWQPINPKMPEATVDWCAIGITTEEPDCSSSIIHHKDGDGFDEMQRHVKFTVIATFYGPNSRGNANMMRDGLALAQNREALYPLRMNLVTTDMPITRAPELINKIWYQRSDVSMLFVRAINRQYAVENLLKADGSLTKDLPIETTPWQAGPNPPDLIR